MVGVGVGKVDTVTPFLFYHVVAGKKLSLRGTFFSFLTKTHMNLPCNNPAQSYHHSGYNSLQNEKMKVLVIQRKGL